jgi:hypothetical protein
VRNRKRESGKVTELKRKYLKKSKFKQKVVAIAILQQQLLQKVENNWATESGVNGVRFTDKATGGSIFLPTANYPDNFVTTSDIEITLGLYWSSTDANGHNAFHLNFSNNRRNMVHSDYRFRFSIRPVKNYFVNIHPTNNNFRL